MNKLGFATRLVKPIVLILLASAFSMAVASDSKEQEREDVRAMARNALERLYREQPEAKGVIEKAAGYAVFNNRGVKILVAGGGKGEGIALDNRTRKEVFMKMVEAQAGLGVGIKKFYLIWVFETPSTLDRFIQQGWELGGQAGFTARASGVGGGFAGAASVKPGACLNQLTDDGLTAEITVKGSKYYKDDDLN